MDSKPTRRTVAGFHRADPEPLEPIEPDEPVEPWPVAPEELGDADGVVSTRPIATVT